MSLKCEGSLFISYSNISAYENQKKSHIFLIKLVPQEIVTNNVFYVHVSGNI